MYPSNSKRMLTIRRVVVLSQRRQSRRQLERGMEHAVFWSNLMANPTPLSTVLALLGSTCHYLDITTKALGFFPSYIANSSPVLFALMLVNSILALSYLVIGWHVLGWIGVILRVIGTRFEQVHTLIAYLSVRGLRYCAGSVMHASRSFFRWLN